MQKTLGRLYGRVVHPFRHVILLWSVWVACFMDKARSCEEIIHSLAAVFFTTASSQNFYCVFSGPTELSNRFG